jgi:hypothetical protein
MSYTLTYSIGTLTVVDTTINTQTSLALPGKNYPGYGAPVDQNQLSMLENWASNTSGPYAPIPGQTWYDSSNVQFKINTSTNVSPVWKSVAFEGAPVVFSSVTTPILTSGSNATAGTITGDWTLTAGSTFQATYA